jgi:3-methylcrotonyl-CoA carboxylase alpha subunit
MLAKIIARGADREEARRRLSAALGETLVAGVRTNRRFLKSIVDHPAFAEVGLDTTFIERHGELFHDPPKPDDRITALAALAFLAKARRDQAEASGPADPFSPWSSADGWRLNGDGRSRFALATDGGPLTVTVQHGKDGLFAEWPDGAVPISGTPDDDGHLRALIGPAEARAVVAFDEDRLTLFVDGEAYAFSATDPHAVGSRQGAAAGRLTAPMPGTVIAVGTKPGDSVAKGHTLVVVEAMKMEHAVSAPRGGRIKRVAVAVGDLVAEGTELVVMEEVE